MTFARTNIHKDLHVVLRASQSSSLCIFLENLHFLPLCCSPGNLNKNFLFTWMTQESEEENWKKGLRKQYCTTYFWTWHHSKQEVLLYTDEYLGLIYWGNSRMQFLLRYFSGISRQAVALSIFLGEWLHLQMIIRVPVPGDFPHSKHARRG